MWRIATFNVENLDDRADDHNPPLEVRAPILRAAILRLNADVLCLQEVHGQELPDHRSNHPSRHLSALDAVLEGTPYATYGQAHTVTTAGVAYDVRNLVILSAFPIRRVSQYRNDLINKLQYRQVTAMPEQPTAKDVGWERPILHVEVEVVGVGLVHVINLHMKSRRASNVAGQLERYEWKSAAGWAEGYFLSAIKRVGQALEVRMLIDQIFDAEPEANIVVCGDFNAEPGEVPVEAIAGAVENTNNPDLRSRVLIPCSRRIPESVRYSLFHHGQGNLLDHMLMSQSLLGMFGHAEIHNENLHDESLPFNFDTKYPESDHAPFVAEFINELLG